MDALLLQDWVTIDANAQIASVIQSADCWMDVGDAEDLVFFLDVKEVANAPIMNYETSAVAEDSSFLTIIAPFTLGTGLRVDPALLAYAMTPAAQYVRWHITSSNVSASWNVTFRVWLATYSLAG